MNSTVIPAAIVLLNGKRKCGKDYFAEILAQGLGDVSKILHLSEEIKREYAQLHSLDYELLLTDSPYKDTYRTEMIALGESRRNADPGHYCRLATQHCVAPVWIIVDNRRQSDIAFFKSTYPQDVCLVVRITADDDVRKERGWVWKSGVDNVESECGLDDYPPDVVVRNNGGDETEFQACVGKVKDWVLDKLKVS